MMQPGIFAKTFVRPTLAQTLDAIVAHRLRYTQFNLACAGLPSMPDQLDPATIQMIRREFEQRHLTMAAISGTFNMIHPDPHKRSDGLRRLAVLAAACEPLGTSIITLCTGTRDPDNIWRRHPDNDTIAAWDDLLGSMRSAVEMADQYGVTLAFEPETGNVIDQASKGRRLLDEIHSPRLKVVIDAANLFHPADLPRMPQVLDEAFALLGPDIALAHAKDLDQYGETGQIAPGKGVLDFDRYLKLLDRVHYRGPLIMHALDESEVADSVAFLQGKLAAIR
jgi:sugar phosphate isomerase/epimerase